MSKTRAAVPPPRKSFLPETVEVEASDNMKAEKLAPMTFNMPRDWHTEFKTTAVLHGMNMKELLQASFEAWKREHKNQ
jgi:hypothetical protein